MDDGLQSRIPMLGLTGLADYCPTIVADGDGGDWPHYGDEDCVDGAMMRATPHWPQPHTYNKEAQNDSILSSGYSSGMMESRLADQVADLTSSHLPTVIAQNTDINSDINSGRLTSVGDDEAYGSLPSIPCVEDIFTQDIDGDTMLHLAIIHESADMAMAFICSARNTGDLMMVNNLGQTPLHLATYVNMPVIVDMLISHRVDLDTRDRNGNTALHLACREGHPFVMKSLLEAQPQLASLKNYDGLTCLHLALKHRHSAILFLLAQSGAININSGDGCSGRSVLHQAVQAGDVELTNFLLTRCRADVNCPARDGLTPIMIAAGQRNWTIVSLLQQHGAVYTESSHDDDGFCSEDDMDIESSILSVKHLSLNGVDHSDEEDLYS